MWIRSTFRKPQPPCLAFDAVRKTIGLWNGLVFDSFTGGYSFSSEEAPNMVFWTEDHTRICGILTHWCPLPENPIDSDHVGYVLKGQDNKKQGGLRSKIAGRTKGNGNVVRLLPVHNP